MIHEQVIGGRVLRPDEVGLLQGVLESLKIRGCLPYTLEQQRDLASYLLRMYLRGLVVEDKLIEVGAAAARHRYKLPMTEEPAPNSLEMCKVLIVEDQYAIAQELRVAFTRAGAHVVGPFGNEEAALAAIEHEVPDVAVIDLNLGDGVRFHVSESLSRQDVPVCIYSAYSRADFRNAPRLIDRCPWMEKPASPSALIGLIGSVLRRAPQAGRS